MYEMQKHKEKIVSIDMATEVSLYNRLLLLPLERAYLSINYKAAELWKVLLEQMRKQSCIRYGNLGTLHIKGQSVRL